MSEIDNGGMFSPQIKGRQITAYESEAGTAGGITRRDWLAGMAMQGIASNLDSAGSIDEIASVAYSLTDALILEGRKGGE